MDNILNTISNSQHQNGDTEDLLTSYKSINPLYTNGFFLLVQYNKLGILHSHI